MMITRVPSTCSLFKIFEDQGDQDNGLLFQPHFLFCLQQPYEVCFIISICKM